MASYDEYALRGMQQELQEIDARRDALVRDIQRLQQKTGVRGSIAPPSRVNMMMTPEAPAKRRRNLTPEGRQRLVDAQKKRWEQRRAREAAEAEKEQARATMPRHRKANNRLDEAPAAESAE